MVEYTTDHGDTWHLMSYGAPPPYHIGDDMHHPSTVITSDALTNDNIITIPLPLLTYGRIIRLKIRDETMTDVRSIGRNKWAILELYFGTECSGGCNNAGFCRNGTCACSPMWSGENCGVPASSLPEYLADEFDSSFRQVPENWAQITGGKITSCPEVGVGQALFFDGLCNRYLETIDLDLVDTHYLEFTIGFGSCNNDFSPSNGFKTKYNNINRGYKNAAIEAVTNYKDRKVSPRRRTKRDATYFETEFDAGKEESREAFLHHPGAVPVLVEASCDGGRSWTTLKIVDPQMMQQPSLVHLQYLKKIDNVVS